MGQTNRGVVPLRYTLEVLSVVSRRLGPGNAATSSGCSNFKEVEVDEHILLEQTVAEAKRPTSIAIQIAGLLAS